MKNREKYSKEIKTTIKNNTLDARMMCKFIRTHVQPDLSCDKNRDRRNWNCCICSMAFAYWLDEEANE